MIKMKRFQFLKFCFETSFDIKRDNSALDNFGSHETHFEVQQKFSPNFLPLHFIL